LFWAFLLVVLSSPLVWYARTTAAEPLATGLLVCLVAATVLRAPAPVVAVAALGACWTKETSYPFVAVLGLLGLDLARRRTGLPIRRHIIWGAAGIIVAFAAASLFNVVRFGSILSANFFEPKLQTPGVTRQLEYGLGVLVSPSGGMFVFWPTASVLVLTACLSPLFVRSRSMADARPALVLLAVIFGLTLGLASWWQPFGWAGYGPRLALPWGLPLVLLALVAYGEQLGNLVQRVLTRWWGLLLLFGVVLAFSLPHIGHMWRPHQTDRFFSQKPPCVQPWIGGVAKFHACQHQAMWFYRPMPLYALQGLKTPSGASTSSTRAAVSIRLFPWRVIRTGTWTPRSRRFLPNPFTITPGLPARATSP